jgi:hypothetical protein
VGRGGLPEAVVTRRVKDLFIGVGAVLFGAFCVLMEVVRDRLRRRRRFEPPGSD